MKKIKMNKREIIKKYGNEKQNDYYERHNLISQTSEKAIYKTLIQKYGFVQRHKEKRNIYYVLGSKRKNEINRRHKEQKFKASFYKNKVVYMVTNIINGKKYVGSTSEALASRMSKHKNSSFDSDSLNYNTKIAQAFRKHGWDNFKWQVLEEVEDKKELKKIECYWIASLGTYKNDTGYNDVVGKWAIVKGDDKNDN